MANASQRKTDVKSKLRNPLLGGHRGKEPSKFQFDISVNRVVGGSKAEYSVKWFRGTKSVSTKPFFAEPKSKQGVSIKEKLSLLCTLYRGKSAEMSDFEPKDSKICLIAHKGEGSKGGKTIGKMHFDLSQFVGVPSASADHTFQVNAKTQVFTTITCTFVRLSKGTASSQGSGMSGMTVSSGGFDDERDDDFGDLLDLPSAGDEKAETLTSPVSPSKDSGFKRIASEASGEPEGPTSGTQSVSSLIHTYSGSPSSSAVLPENETITLQRRSSNETKKRRVKESRQSSSVAAETPELQSRDSKPKDSKKRSSVMRLEKRPKDKTKDTAVDSDSEATTSKKKMSGRLSEKYSKEKSKVATLESTIEELQQNASAAQKEADQHKAKNLISESKNRDLQKKIELAESSRSAAGAAKEQDFEEELESLKKDHERQVAKLYRQVASAAKDKVQLENEHRASQKALASLQAAASLATLSSKKSEGLAEECGKMKGDLFRLRDKNENLNAELELRNESIEILKKELRDMRFEKGEEIRNLRQAAVDAASAALDDSGEDDCLRNLEEALSDATKREDQYEEEILKMTQIVDGLSRKLKEVQVESEAKVLDAKASGTSIRDLNLNGSSAASILAAEVASESVQPAKVMPCPKCAARDEHSSTEKSSETNERKKPTKKAKTKSSSHSVKSVPSKCKKEPPDSFISSRSIREVNMSENITDNRLLNMLVDTKMKLAIAEQEKVRAHLVLAVHEDGNIFSYWRKTNLFVHYSCLSILLFRNSSP